MSARVLKVAKLAVTEKIFYVICLALIVFYSLKVTINESKKLKHKSMHSKSWFQELFGYKVTRDHADYQWIYYTRILFANFDVLYLFLLVVVHYLSIKFVSKFHKTLILIYSIGLFIHIFTAYAFLIVFISTLFMYFVTALFKSKMLVWAATIFSMIAFDTEYLRVNLANAFQEKKIDKMYLNLYYITIFFMILRIVSFCLEKVNLKTHDESYKLADLILYTFYPTFIFIAPFITYKNFSLTFVRKQTFFNRYILMLIIRVAFSLLLIELVLHFTIVFSIHEDSRLVKKASEFTLAMSLLLKGALFAVRYIVYYGVPTIFNEIVGMRTTPLPRCIALIHTNGEMWKYFDTGIYEFIKNNLYIPMGGNKINKFRQLLSLFVSFAFISYWHGHSLNVVSWSIGNFTMIVIELAYFNLIAVNASFKRFMNQFSDLNRRRLLCCLLACWQSILYIIAFFFLSDIKITWQIYNKLLLKNSLLGVLLFMFGYYCNAQIRVDQTEFKF